MTRAPDQMTAVSGLPGLFEALRMVSGLLAVAAVGVIVLATSLIAEHDALLVGIPVVGEPAVQPAPPPDRRIVTVQSTPTQQVFVFYLVATPAQADMADWGEQVGANEAWRAVYERTDRAYEILFVRDDAEAQVAATTILDRMVAFGRTALVEVVDLRSVFTGP